MMTDLIIRYFHFLAILAMFALLMVQHLLLKNTVDHKGLKKIAALDMVYGLSALVVFLMGLALWLWVGKPKEFYTHNWVFHTKMTLFFVVAILSVIPTLFIRKNLKASADVTVPKSIVMIIRMELLLVCIIPLLAVLMANGIGYTR